MYEQKPLQSLESITGRCLAPGGFQMSIRLPRAVNLFVDTCPGIWVVVLRAIHTRGEFEHDSWSFRSFNILRQSGLISALRIFHNRRPFPAILC